MQSKGEDSRERESEEAFLAKAKRYQRIHLKLRVIKGIIWIAFLLIILLTGISIILRDTAASINPNPWLVVALYFLALSLSAELLFLPLSYYSGFLLEHRFGLSTESRLGWAKDYLKALAISLALSLLVVEALYYLLREGGKWWWLMAAFGFTLFFILLAKITPIILLPLFFKLKPLDDKELNERLLGLAEKVGVRIIGVTEMDLSRKSKTANAALAGLGSSRRIILSDTLLRNFNPDEIETVMAHEFGHYVYSHLWKGIFIQSGFSLICFYLIHILLGNFIKYFNFHSKANVASFPLLILIALALGFLLMPWANVYSRRQERKADRFALEKTKKPRAFISAMKMLSKLNLSDPQPHPLVEFIFYSHPSIGRRIKIAEKFYQKKADSPFLL